MLFYLSLYVIYIKNKLKTGEFVDYVEIDSVHKT